MKIAQKNQEKKDFKKKALINAFGITVVGFLTLVVGIILWFLPAPAANLSDSTEKLKLIFKLVLALGVISVLAGAIWIIFILYSKKYK